MTVQPTSALNKDKTFDRLALPPALAPNRQLPAIEPAVKDLAPSSAAMLIAQPAKVRLALQSSLPWENPLNEF